MRLVAVLLMASWALLAQDSRGWLNQGVSEFKSGNYRQAVALFQKAVDSDPSYVPGHLYLATALMQQYIPGAQSAENVTFATGADMEFRKVLELDPGNMTAMMSLASLDLNRKKWDKAQAWYQKAVAADPSNSVAWYSMGFIAWSRWYPPYMEARASVGLKPADPGPLPAGPAKARLKADYALVVEGGLYDLQQALLTNPQYDDAMAYINLLIRERADLRDDAAEYQRDIAEANSWVDKALATKKARAGAGNPAGFAAPPPPPPPPPPPGAGAGQREAFGQIRVSGEVMQAQLIRQAPPVYPSEAKSLGISGTVTLSVTVGKDGSVKDVNLREGPALLAQAAIDAVRQWVYKPTMLNDEPVEVVTSVTVNFTLQQE